MEERISRHGTLARALVGLTASLALLVGLVTAGLTVRWVQLRELGTDGGFPTNGVDPSGSPAPTRAGPCADEACNYLILGSDSRAGLSAAEYGTNEDIGGTNRADTIMLVHTD